jgi:hypothetical protein
MRHCKGAFGVVALLITGCQPEPPLFQQLPADQTGVTFENKLTESETQNILAYEYFYNGGGIAAADFSNKAIVIRYLLSKLANFINSNTRKFLLVCLKMKDFPSFFFEKINITCNTNIDRD